MFRKIKATTMIIGQRYHVSFYDNKEVKHKCVLTKKPDKPIGLMTPKDEYKIEIDGVEVSFNRNTSPPHFLETRRMGKRGMVNVRASFYEFREAA